MNSIKIQINHEEAITVKELAYILHNQIGEEYNLTIEEIQDYFTIEAANILPNKSFNTIVVFDLPEFELRDIEPKDIVFSFLDSVKNETSVLSVIKVNDTILQEKAFTFYQEIIDLEMDFRNILTYILNYDNKYIGEELFKDFGIAKSEKIDFEKLQEKYENGLFYIYFNHYANFSTPEKIKAEKIADLLQDISIVTFENFKEKLQNRAILEPRHLSFLYTIKTKLKPLEDMRNAIMHIRNLSDNVIKNYNKAVNDFESDKGIKTIIKNFWQEENDALKEQTWLALAKSEIKKFITVDSMLEGKQLFRINDDYNDYDFVEGYIGTDDLKTDLIPYLNRLTLVPNFDSTIAEFEPKIDELLNTIFPI